MTFFVEVPTCMEDWLEKRSSMTNFCITNTLTALKLNMNIEYIIVFEKHCMRHRTLDTPELNDVCHCNARAKKRSLHEAFAFQALAI